MELGPGSKIAVYEERLIIHQVSQASNVIGIRCSSSS